MITLYDNPFSPFARKVRLVLDHKGLEYESVDALALRHHGDLLAVNPRAEVPALADGDVVAVNSSDIVAYLEHRYPDVPVLPTDPGVRVAARSWERLADGVVDSIIHDISLWVWPTHRRQDSPPPGLIEAGRRDLAAILGMLEKSASADGFLCGALSVADFALFPHVSSMRPLGVALDPGAHPKLLEWNRRMRALPCVRKDLEHVKRLATERFAEGASPYEGEKIVWRGDRLEWLFGHGFHAWWLRQLEAGHVVIPAATSP